MLIVTYFPSISSIVMAVIGLEFATFRAVLTVLFNDAHYMGSFLGVLFPVVMAIIFSEFAGTRLAAVLLSQNG
ncbi:MAG TPA: hypothetical protein DCS21_01305 [Gammaproteobacteria bacterium]|nr:hypothetical protein [Gammaproteobacteria bacterium]